MARSEEKTGGRGTTTKVGDIRTPNKSLVEAESRYDGNAPSNFRVHINSGESVKGRRG